MRVILLSIFVLAFVAVPAYCNTDPITFEEIKNILKNLPKTVFGSDPINNPEISAAANELPIKLDDINDLPIDEYLTEAKNRCINVTNEAAFNEVGNELKNLNVCLANLVNFDTLKSEIELKSKTGDLDEVFNVYCRKRHTVIPCLTNFLNKLDGCLYPNERAHVDLGFTIFKTMIDFVCYKEGDHIALFIAEKGPECFEERQAGLQKCGEDYTARYTTDGEFAVKALDRMMSSFCTDFHILQNCLVQELEKCDYTTPANLVDSGFRVVNKECQKRNKN